MEVEQLVETLGEPIARGAEAYLYLIDWLGERAVLKLRLPKRYRHAALDTRLRWRRTVTEARAMLAALEAGVPVPKLYYVDPLCSIIVMEYINGVKLADLIEAGDPRARSLARLFGTYAAKLHEAGISHGDLTTSNVLVAGDNIFLIDFGLASLKSSEREQAVDVHLYMRSLESTHPEAVEEMLEAFLEGYRSVRGADKTERIMELVREIRLMGRYRAERRTAWRQE
ncbi:Kae1-associated kinase Bud32 [Hyperthermus butylicus]|uniref:Kae1-associated kinase Bud32 n=1 Tax=Hyperthermus butylicus TaxID=54248 RepID=UPI00069112B2|nr:Kae1-associated kinase Bud32 [Hyperthermus butylicus]